MRDYIKIVDLFDIGYLSWDLLTGPYNRIQNYEGMGVICVL